MAKKTTATETSQITSEPNKELSASQVETVSSPTENATPAVKKRVGRPKLTKKSPVAKKPVAKKTAAAKVAKKTDTKSATPGRRGRKPKVAAEVVSEVANEVVAVEPKRRGRKPKPVTEAPKEVIATEPKRRGRKPKVATEVANEVVAVEPKRRGRKPKVAAEVANEVVAAEPKRRGRKPKVATEVANEVVAIEPKRRGRKPKAVVAAPVDTAPKRRGRKPKVVAETVSTEPVVEASTEATPVVAAEPKRRGRPKGSVAKKTTAKKPATKRVTRGNAAAKTEAAKVKEVPAHNYISWFEIPALSFERAVNFYNYVFGIKMETTQLNIYAMAFFPSTTGIGGAVVAGQGCVPSDKGPLLYLNAGSDLDGILARINEAGGLVLMGKTFINESAGYFSLFIDTEGNRLALHAKD